MNRIINVEDFWQISIMTEKHGILVFKTIDYSRLDSVIKEIKENPSYVFEILIRETYLNEKNDIPYPKLIAKDFSNCERYDFYEKLIQKQF